MHTSFLVLADDVISAHYYCSNVCAEGIFLTFIQILYLIIIRPRVRRQSDCVSCRNDLRGSEGELLFLIRFLILFSMFAPCILLSDEFLFALWITFLPFSRLLFFPYMSIALIQTPTCSRHEYPF